MQLDSTRTNLVIQKCLEAIRNMVATKDIIDEGFIAFEDDLQNLFVLLDRIDKIEFENYLLDITTEIAKNVSINTTIFEIVERNLIRILQKNDNVIDNVFDLFYHWCYNGCVFISTEAESLLKEVKIIFFF